MSRYRWIPNFLSFFRMMLAVPLVFSIWRGDVWVSLVLLGVAGITDVFDGILARALECRSRLGAWLDPAADKVVVVTVLITLAFQGVIPIWFFVITLFRDLGLVTGIAVYALRGYRIRVRPALSGKIAVASQNVALLAAIVSPISMWLQEMLPIALAFSALLTLLSAFAYGRSPRQFVDIHHMQRTRPGVSGQAFLSGTKAR